MDIERIARAHAQSVYLEKRAGISSALNAVAANPAAVGGAVLGAGIGAYRGRQGSREGEKGYGTLTGGLLGAIGGGIAGAGARSLYKNVPAGYKQIKSGKDALAKELEREGIKATDKAAVKEYLKKQRGDLRDATELATAGLEGSAARKAIDQVRGSGQYGAVADIKSGREKFYGGLIGGGLGLGYGAYQLADAKNINAPKENEAPLRKFVNAKERIDRKYGKAAIRAAQTVT